jgi:hypothetical protein
MNQERAKAIDHELLWSTYYPGTLTVPADKGVKAHGMLGVICYRYPPILISANLVSCMTSVLFRRVRGAPPVHFERTRFFTVAQRLAIAV